MIRAAIIDDEANNIENIKGLLQKYCPDVAVVGTAKSAIDGLQLITDLNPELLFLDIQMPEKNGFEMLENIGDRSFELILITAYDQYGIQAIKFSAIDYLLKPINIDDLISSVARVSKKLGEKRRNYELENLLTLIRNREEKTAHKLALPTLKETRFVYPRSIIRCESSNAYTTFVLSDGEKIMVSKPIYEYEELLSDFGFLRCHQSHLVNKQYIKSYLKEAGGFLILDNGDEVPISRSKKEIVKQMLNHLK